MTHDQRDELFLDAIIEYMFVLIDSRSQTDDDSRTRFRMRAYFVNITPLIYFRLLNNGIMQAQAGVLVVSNSYQKLPSTATSRPRRKP